MKAIAFTLSHLHSRTGWQNRGQKRFHSIFLPRCIVRARLSTNASTNSSIDIFKSDATPHIVSSVGDLVPLSHLDQVGASTPVFRAKTEYENSKNFSLVVVDELDNNTIVYYKALTLKSIVACLQIQRYPWITPSNRNAQQHSQFFGYRQSRNGISETAKQHPH